MSNGLARGDHPTLAKACSPRHRKRFPQELEARAAPSPTPSRLPLGLYQLASLCCGPGYRGGVKEQMGEEPCPYPRGLGPGQRGLGLSLQGGVQFL